MAIDLTSKTVLKGLQAKPNSPYWMRIEKGRHIGYRKIDADHATWLARRRPQDASTSTGSASYEYKPLGSATKTFDYSAAKRKAEEWFNSRAEGIPDDVVTIETIAKEYVEDRRTEKGETTANDAEIRFKRTLYGTPFGQTPLVVGKLTMKKLKDWRAGIGGGNAAKDREWRRLRAALNLAVRNRRCPPGLAIEWQSVPPLKDAKGRRSLFLDLKQRRALIKAATGITKDTIELAAVTGARPGELARLKRGDVDLKLGTITFTGKTGARTVPLSPAAITVCKRLCKDKLPNVRLLPWDYPIEWSREIRDAAKRAELPDGVVLYTLRHSFITEALRGGMSTLDVARLTGTSLQMIEAHYGQYVLSAARERLAQVVML